MKQYKMKFRAFGMSLEKTIFALDKQDADKQIEQILSKPPQLIEVEEMEIKGKNKQQLYFENIDSKECHSLFYFIQKGIKKVFKADLFIHNALFHCKNFGITERGECKTCKYKVYKNEKYKRCVSFYNYLYEVGNEVEI